MNNYNDNREMHDSHPKFIQSITIKHDDALSLPNTDRL